MRGGILVFPHFECTMRACVLFERFIRFSMRTYVSNLWRWRERKTIAKQLKQPSKENKLAKQDWLLQKNTKGHNGRAAERFGWQSNKTKKSTTEIYKIEKLRR